MSAEVLSSQTKNVWLRWQPNGRGRWHQFGSACPVSDLPTFALNVLRRRVGETEKAAFGIAADPNAHALDRLSWPDFESLIASQNGSGLTEEGREELRRRILNP